MSPPAAVLCFAGRAPNTIILCVCVCVTYSKENISVHDEYMWLFVCIRECTWLCLCVKGVSISASLTLTTWEHSVSIRPVLILRCILPRGLFLVDREQIWTLCLWFCDFWVCSLSKHEWKKRMWGQTGCYTRACFSSRVYKKMTGFVIMTVHGEAPW